MVSRFKMDFGTRRIDQTKFNLIYFQLPKSVYTYLNKWSEFQYNHYHSLNLYEKLITILWIRIMQFSCRNLAKFDMKILVIDKCFIYVAIRNICCIADLNSIFLSLEIYFTSALCVDFWCSL